MDGRAARILALGLVWGIGVLALVVQHVDRPAPRRSAPPPAPTAPAAVAPSLDCLLQAPAARIDIVGGVVGCEETREERFRLTWDDDRVATLALPDRQMSLPVARGDRRSFVASLADAIHRPVPAAGGCSAVRFVELDWRCGAGAPMHAQFSESYCGASDRALEAGPVNLVGQALRRVVLKSGPAVTSP